VINIDFRRLSASEQFLLFDRYRAVKLIWSSDPVLIVDDTCTAIKYVYKFY
jgi:hypothetical protein